ncbi:hypothetical protein [Streptomyces zingiberis]|uniref:Secreted protein n=1 Tax=Streptomyces zingiberis TaxID=2053010 RepID=A0ABX1BQR0_9ACTN|nr:hypothetical protein [Streptomyces zingiberis]NJQ00066.1 hypothetical protein [Streptomyces zingiberis]
MPAVSGLLALAALAGGGLAARQQLAGADRSAPTEVWAEPSAARDGEDGEDLADGDGGLPVGPDTSRAGQELAALLLPVPEDHQPGPDLDEFGHSAVLGRERAVRLLTTGGSAAQRRQWKRTVAELRVTGLAMRSYASRDLSTVTEIRIVRTADATATARVGGFYALAGELMGGTAESRLRPGPELDGAPEASCVVARDEDPDGDELGSTLCVARQGPFLLSGVVSGPGQYTREMSLDLLTEQLERLASAGEER